MGRDGSFWYLSVGSDLNECIITHAFS
jgi:hypothetical protein